MSSDEHRALSIIRSYMRKARRVPIRRWFWVVLSFLSMSGFWLLVRWFNFYSVYKVVKKIVPHRSVRLRPTAVESICWAVPRVGKMLFGKNDGCLYQALAGELLLSWAGKKAALKIGVRKTGDQKILAHAWVEGDEGILIGGEQKFIYNTFQVLPDLSIAFKVS